jgi:hypothetical protein
MRRNPTPNPALPANPVVPVWVERRAALARRRDRAALIANFFAVSFILTAVFVAFAFGSGRSWEFAPRAAEAAILTLVVFVVAAFVAPVKVIGFAAKLLRAVSHPVFVAFSVVAIASLFVLLLPFSRLIGRRGFVARHPGAAAWVAPVAWRRSTWSPKRSEAQFLPGRHPMLRVLALFLAQRNWFLLLVSLVLLAFASVLAAANSSVVAPFIYTLF